MAEAGDASAQFILGLMYDNGDGVRKDSVEAHAWYNNASANGDEEAKKNLSNIEKTMNPDQISDANKLAREIFNRISTKKNYERSCRYGFFQPSLCHARKRRFYLSYKIV